MQEQTEERALSTIDTEAEPIPYWPLWHWPPDAAESEAYDRWARLDALAGWVE